MLTLIPLPGLYPGRRSRFCQHRICADAPLFHDSNIPETGMVQDVHFVLNQQGRVIVRIWVDQQGRVTRAEYQPKGSNTSNGYLVSQAKAAALKARFNADTQAVIANLKKEYPYIKVESMK